MSTTTTGYRFLAITFRDAYGQKELVGEVWGVKDDESEARREYGWSAVVQDGPFGGDATESLVLTAYVDHQYRAENDRPDDIWGMGVSFMPHNVKLADAERMVKVLKTIERKAQKVADEDGYPQSYAEWIARHAKILGCTRIRVWEPDGFNRRKLGRAMKLTEGAAFVQDVAQKWGRGESLEAAIAS